MPVLGVLLALLAGAVAARHGTPLGPDLPLHRWALRHRNGALTDAAIVLTTTGTGLPAYLVAAVAGAAGRLRSTARWQGAGLAVAALAVGQLVRVGLAQWVGRSRPPLEDWAYHAGGPALPSGHATSSALTAAIVCTAVRRVTARPGTRTAWCTVALLWAAGVGATRVYLGVHWPTDVLAGWLLAGALTCTALCRPWPPAAGKTAPGAASRLRRSR